MTKPAGLAVLLLPVFGSLAHGGAVVELVPSNSGPYFGGESIAVDVWMTSDTAEPRLLDVARFDFENSDERVQLAPVLSFDFTTIPSGLNGYLTFPELPRPATFQSFDCICPQHYIPLPSQEAVHIASLQVELPLEQGTYLIDALNAKSTGDELGARIEVISTKGLGEPDIWLAQAGQITDGRVALEVIPEPSSLLICACLYVATVATRNLKGGISGTVTDDHVQCPP